MSDVQTIEQMIAAVGAPRNYAEQALLNRMREYAAAESAPGMTAGYTEWIKALITMHCILTFREHGGAPVIPGVYGVPAGEVQP